MASSLVTREVVGWQAKLAMAGARLRADVVFAVIDAILIVIAYSAALALRFIDIQTISPSWWRGFAFVMPAVIAVHLLANFLFGGYGHEWEYASVEEAMRLVLATMAAAFTLLGGMLAYRGLTLEEGPLPLMVLAIGAMLTLGGMGAIRFRSRLFSFNRAVSAIEPTVTLIVGTDRGAVDLARRGLSGPNPVAAVGFLSVNGKVGSRRIAGLPVLGRVGDLRTLVKTIRFDQVVVAGSVGDQVVREVVDACMDVDVRLRILPNMNNVLGSNGTLRDVRDLEITDLLPRPAVAMDLELVRQLVSGRVVMVTGAGGSIGTEIVKQVLALEPDRVVCVDHDETHLYEAALRWSSPLADQVLCDVKDRNHLLGVFAEHRPDVVFHAAAHKHVPILEAVPEEAVKTNILGTANVLEGVKLYGAERFVLISTDKAVAPRSVMGASKRVAEMITRAASTSRGKCVYTAVRFGNVLGSRGSVVPTFTYQILKGGPVTISDPAMTRYFMTVPEAVELVLQASAIAEDGDVLVLDMGEPMKIVDLAHRMIRLAGLVPGRDIHLEVTGARPGEKMSEEVSVEPLTPSAHAGIGKCKPACPGRVTLLDAVGHMEQLAYRGDRQALREVLFSLVSSEWSADETVSLDDEVISQEQIR